MTAAVTPLLLLVAGAVGLAVFAFRIARGGR